MRGSCRGPSWLLLRLVSKVVVRALRQRAGSGHCLPLRSRVERGRQISRWPRHVLRGTFLERSCRKTSVTVFRREATHGAHSGAFRSCPHFPCSSLNHSSTCDQKSWPDGGLPPLVAGGGLGAWASALTFLLFLDLCEFGREAYEVAGELSAGKSSSLSELLSPSLSAFVFRVRSSGWAWANWRWMWMNHLAFAIEVVTHKESNAREKLGRDRWTRSIVLPFPNDRVACLFECLGLVVYTVA